MDSAEQRRAIEETAARLYLRARTTDADDDWDAAYRWVEEDPAHGVAFAKAEAGWELTARLREVDLRLAPETVAGPAGRFEALFGRRAFAGLLAASLVGTIGVVAIQKWVDVERHRTAIGEERAVRLADGSMVRLNTDSAVEVSLRSDRRFVRLLHGEASFDVAHEPARPFVVRANATTMRALGTAFNVRLRPELTELTVMKGRVAVRDGPIGGGRTVDAGTGAAIRGGAVALTTLADSQIARRTAWQAGEITLDGDTLAQAIEEFNRYREAPLVIGDPRLAALRLSGVYPANRGDRFVADLARRFGVRAIPSGDRSIILLAAETDAAR